MSEKRPDVYRKQRENRRQAYMTARTLRDTYPEVEELVLEMTFSDPTGIGKHSPQMQTLSPGAKAYFSVPCPSSLCIGGDFDLGSAIDDMVSGGKRKASGKLNCQGWRDRDPNSKHGCVLELRYRFSVRYKA
jgi:hypothetical protein